jgi:glutathione S-transferase
MKPRIIGRSSSHHTRVARIFASELGIKYAFGIVENLMSQNVDDYVGNPALKLPALQTGDDLWFGTLPICRVLSRIAERRSKIIWPEALVSPLLSNAQELTTQAMATEVSLVISTIAGHTEDLAREKLRASLTNTISWLNAHIRPILEELPHDRDLSYLEVTLFCLVTHLEFREVLRMDPYPNLNRFCERYGERPACRDTPYVFDS